MYVAFEETLRKVSGAKRLCLQGNAHSVTDLIRNVTDDVINVRSALHGRTLTVARNCAHRVANESAR